MVEASQLARVIRVYREPPRFDVVDELAEFVGRANTQFYLPEVDYAGLYQAYGEKPRDFREKVANLQNQDVLEQASDEPLRVNWVTSADVMAYRSGKVVINPLAAIGVVHTGDNQILVGVRGGEVTPERVQKFASGLYGCPPGGSVTFKPSYEGDPVIDTLVSEFASEVGNFDITRIRTIGVCEAFTPGPIGTKFIGVINTDAKLEQVQDRNLRARMFYEHWIKGGATKEQAQHEMLLNNMPIDAWEHELMVGLPFYADSIRKHVNSMPQAFSGIGAGALMTYADWFMSHVTFF